MPVVPDFLVIGAYKSGTTALHYLLAQHPQLFLPRYKEPSFFAVQAPDPDRPRLVDAVANRDEYDALFDARRPGQLIGEVAPEYLASRTAPAAVHAAAPHAKLIAILRNPIERAYSDYLMYVRENREPADFVTALDEQSARAGRHDPTGYYVATGMYGSQLARYYERFPAAHVRVYRFEDLQADARAVCRDAFAFLGVDPGFAPQPALDTNPSGIPPNRLIRGALRRLRPRRGEGLWLSRAKSWAAKPLNLVLLHPPMPEAARGRLVEAFRQDITHVERLTGLSLGHWLAPVEQPQTG